MTEKPTFLTEDMLLFLDDLRESGETNMYGAGPYVQDEFGLDKREAREVLRYWMATFRDRLPQEDGSQ